MQRESAVGRQAGRRRSARRLRLEEAPALVDEDRASAHSPLTLPADHASHAASTPRRRSEPEVIMYKHILVAVGTSLSQSALSTAIARARECDARLTALHVVDRTPWWAV